MPETINISDCLRSEDPSERRDGCAVIAEERRVEYIPELVTLLSDDDVGVKEAALNALVSIGGEDVAEAVVPLLTSSEASMRNIAVEVLEALGEDAFDVVVSLLRDADDDIVKHALDIISSWSDPRVVEHLIPLVSHINPNIRAAVAVCLGNVQGRESCEVLLSLLDDGEEWVRFSVVEALGQLDDAPLEPLLKALDNDSMIVKIGAIDAVGKVSTPASCAAILSKFKELLAQGHCLPVPAVVDMFEKASMPGGDFDLDRDSKDVFFHFFLEALEDGQREVEKEALRGLALLKDRRGIERVLKYIDGLAEIDEETESLVVDAVVSMAGDGVVPDAVLDGLRSNGTGPLRVCIRVAGRLRAKEAIPALSDLLDLVGKDELLEIVEALEQINSDESVEILWSLVRWDEGHVRRAAVKAIAELVGTEAVPALFDVLRAEPYEDVMEDITDVLAGMPSEEVVKGFVELFSSPSEALRSMAARGLGAVGAACALEHLRAALGDESPRVRKAIYRAMVRLNLPEAFECAIDGLKDGDEGVRQAVLKAIAESDGAWPVDKLAKALKGALNDENMWVRYMAVQLLGEVRVDGFEDLIIGLLSSDEPPVRAAAARALENMGTQKGLPALEELFDHPDPNVSEAAREAAESIRWLHSG